VQRVRFGSNYVIELRECAASVSPEAACWMASAAVAVDTVISVNRIF
jgi:hypothetical protein